MARTTGVVSFKSSKADAALVDQIVERPIPSALAETLRAQRGRIDLYLVAEATATQAYEAYKHAHRTDSASREN